MRVGIIGLGFVGNAIYQTLKNMTDIELYIYDKYKATGVRASIGTVLDEVTPSKFDGVTSSSTVPMDALTGTLESTLKAEILFLCLPTPVVLSGYDLSAIHEICSQLQQYQYQGTVVLKSTVSVGTTEACAQQYQLKIVHNPEFLTARTAVQDFSNQGHIVLGYTESTPVNIKQFYQKYFPLAKISETTSGHSEAMKLFCNSFYAMKVQIFTEFYLFAQQMGLNYSEIRELMLQNGWIHPQHTTIPGPDGSISYGGMCFPKDTQALCKQMKDNGTKCAVLDACICERNEIRSENQT